MSTLKLPIAVIVPILNEAANLPRCLAALSWASQIFVVDSGSTDGSIAIAERYGAEVVQFKFNGVWPKKKNWALENLPFRHEWVLIIDADEVLPPETRGELADLLLHDGRGCTGFWINRRFMFMGKWLKHAYYPNWNLRLFKHRAGRYERLVQGATGSGDNEVHEHIIVQGATGRLRAEMDHYAFPSIGTFVEKHNRYSNWEAQLAVEDGLGREAPNSLQSRQVRFRRWVKSVARRLPARPTLRFIYVYILQGGFLDGREGYIFARLHAFYEFLAVTKAIELRHRLAAEAAPQPDDGAERSPASALSR